MTIIVIAIIIKRIITRIIIIYRLLEVGSSWLFNVVSAFS